MAQAMSMAMVMTMPLSLLSCMKMIQQMSMKVQCIFFRGTPSGLQTSYVWKATGNQLEANFGYCISGAGDINADGYADIIVGAKYYTDPEYKEGSSYVFWGGPTGPEDDYCWFAEGGQDSAYLGRHVDGDADFNGDGYSDFLTSATGIPISRRMMASLIACMAAHGKQISTWKLTPFVSMALTLLLLLMAGRVVLFSLRWSDPG